MLFTLLLFLNIQQPILFIGDSHFEGTMGTHLMQKYTYSRMIAISGAGTATYTRNKILNPCCQYSLRTWNNKKLQTEERGIKKNVLIFKRYKYSFAQLVSTSIPRLVIVHLGNNRGDDHDKFLNIIRQNTNAPIIWIGIFKIKSHAVINKGIKEALKKHKNTYYINVTDLKYLNALHTDLIHYGGDKAKKWANDIYTKIKSLKIN